MAKASSTKVTKASASAPTKSKASKKNTIVETKAKREPSKYNIFCSREVSKWNKENPGRSKEAMKAVSMMWKDSAENPNRGKETKPRAKKAKALSRSPLPDSSRTDDDA